MSDIGNCTEVSCWRTAAGSKRTLLQARELVGLSSGCLEKLPMAISEARTTSLAINFEAISLHMREDASKWPNAFSMSSAMSPTMRSDPADRPVAVGADSCL